MKLETGKVTKTERSDNSALFDRDPKFIETDKAAVAAIVQAAVNVELFTIPLYMTAMYSIQGMHQVTGPNNLYQGKLWPGLAPSFEKNDFGNSPENVNAFNALFSVFVEEMLHLQMAANLANVVGVTPDFTQLSPEDKNYAWNCYGNKDNPSTVIPYILDFKDCKPVLPNANSIREYSDIKVKLDALTEEQNELFLAIEEPDAVAWERIRDDMKDKYRFETPFKNWNEGDELPLFGTIGRMYQCLYDYFNITYKYPDGKATSLWELIYSPGTLQRDIFNVSSPGHPYREYQGFETTVSGWLPEKALDEIILKLISAITDQGEGSSVVKPKPKKGSALQAVNPVNQSSKEALDADYPSYSDSGEQIPSTHGHARSEFARFDHYERFGAIKNDLKAGRIITWDKWRAGEKNRWKAEDLKAKDYDQANPGLPTAEVIAEALNSLAENNREKNYQQFCQIATGAIAGITSVLTNYWKNPTVAFPFPSMGGSGDRVMMCWAVFGELPDLSVGVQPRQKNVLYHACQGLSLDPNNTDDPNVCASPEIYHNCKGSNSCKSEGGCGFAQETGKSNNCGSSSLSAAINEPYNCNYLHYTAPADNLCKAFGGCAVPISASQIYPKFTDTKGNKVSYGIMDLFDFGGPPDYKAKQIDGPGGHFTIASGKFVYDVAWDAYTMVLEHRKSPVPENPPAPTAIRLAFPPST
jgi:hypothetical protein